MSDLPPDEKPILHYAPAKQRFQLSPVAKRRAGLIIGSLISLVTLGQLRSNARELEVLEGNVRKIDTRIDAASNPDRIDTLVAERNKIAEAERPDELAIIADVLYNTGFVYYVFKRNKQKEKSEQTREK